MTTPKRILVIRTGGLGDFILSLPVIRALGTNWPHAEVEILGRPAIATLARSEVSRVTSIDDRRFARLFANTPLDASDPAAVHVSSFELVVSFLGVPESDFGRKLRSLVPRTLFVPPPQARDKHATIHFLESLREAGIEVANAIPSVDITDQDRAEGQRVLQQLLGRQARLPIIAHPGSGGRNKNWPARLFAETIRLFGRSGHQAVVLQGEADGAAVSEVLNHLDQGDVPVLKDATLVQVAGAIACSQLVVGNDSGISHLAAAVGAPLVCLFGPTDPTVWRPLGHAVRVLTFDEATPARVYEEGIGLMNKRTA